MASRLLADSSLLLTHISATLLSRTENLTCLLPVLTSNLITLKWSNAIWAKHVLRLRWGSACQMSLAHDWRYWRQTVEHLLKKSGCVKKSIFTVSQSKSVNSVLIQPKKSSETSLCAQSRWKSNRQTMSLYDAALKLWGTKPKPWKTEPDYYSTLFSYVTLCDVVCLSTCSWLWGSRHFPIWFVWQSYDRATFEVTELFLTHPKCLSMEILWHTSCILCSRVAETPELNN